MTTDERLSKIEAKLDEILRYVRPITPRHEYGHPMQGMPGPTLAAEEKARKMQDWGATPHEMKTEEWKGADDDDAYLVALAKEREGGETVSVTIEELRQEIAKDRADNPDLSDEFIEEAKLAKQDMDNGDVKPYVRRTKREDK